MLFLAFVYTSTYLCVALVKHVAKLRKSNVLKIFVDGLAEKVYITDNIKSRDASASNNFIV